MATSASADLFSIANALLEEVRKREHCFFLVTGEEDYLVHRTGKRVVEALLGDPPPQDALIVVEGKDYQLAALLNDLRMGNLFVPDQLLWIKDPWFLKGNSGNEERQVLRKMLEGGFPPRNTLLITLHGKLDQRQEFTKFLYSKSRNATFPGLDPKTIGDLQQDQSYKILRSHAKRAGKNLTPGAFQSLRQRLENSLFALMTSLEMVIAAVGSREDLQESDVLAVIPKTRQDEVFTLCNDLSEGNLEGALEKLRQFQRRAEPAIVIQSLLAKHLRGLACAKVALLGPLKGRVDVSSYASFSKSLTEWKAHPPAGELGILLEHIGINRHPFPVFLSFQQASAFSLPQLLRGLEELHRIDLASKSTSADDYGLLELFFLRMAKKGGQRG